MQHDLEQLLCTSNTLKSDYLRSLAEFDNYRRRKDKELADFRELANESMMIELIPVLDNFDRALAAAVNTTPESDPGSNGMKKGIELIYRNLRSTLQKFGLQEFSCIGQEFDPHRCEALGSAESSDAAENTVIAETGKGYMYGCKVLRPALVIVARPPANRDAEEHEESET
jgi:molecular chaperone GrpE